MEMTAAAQPTETGSKAVSGQYQAMLYPAAVFERVPTTQTRQQRFFCVIVRHGLDKKPKRASE
jgi:hypothetical protein